ncbi:MAG: DUF3787 domain-containing protein [Clostridiales bacterium]|nr:DUF3787 domain-containing protein [Clostridiales bacterium]
MFVIFKRKNIKNPIESHKTAAWANMEASKEISNVSLPSEMQADNAKDYVDQNEK